jgi:hypothetical protein
MHLSSLTYVLPNVTVEWLALLLRIQEVLASNLHQQTGYNNYGFRYFSQTPQTNVIVIPQIRPRSLRSAHFPIHYPLIILLIGAA